MPRLVLNIPDYPFYASHGPILLGFDRRPVPKRLEKHALHLSDDERTDMGVEAVPARFRGDQYGWKDGGTPLCRLEHLGISASFFEQWTAEDFFQKLRR